jgi:hypothetical protein
MASNDLEILGQAEPEATPAPTAEMNDQHQSLRPVADQLNRRFFMAALGVAGAAAGTALLSGKSAQAQQISPNGYAQVDVLNLMLNIKYLKATLYSFITQGTDLPGSSNVTIGTGQVFNQPKKIAFSTQQITDVFNEMYYDELNQLITLRGLLGVTVAPRQTMDILGTGNLKNGSVTVTQAQAISLARLLEDLSASAFTTAAIYLTGNNLQFASQALATDAMHAGALRLISIQNGVVYQGSQYASYATSNTAITSNNFTAETIAGSSIMFANLPAPAPVSSGPPPNQPAVGNILTGPGMPQGSGAVITAITYAPTVTFMAVSVSTNQLQNVSSIAGLAIGQPITGTSVPAGTYITGVAGNTVTLSVPTTAASVVNPTGFVTKGSPTITGVSSFTGILDTTTSTPPPTISGTGIAPGATIIGVNSGAGTITMSANATASSATAFTGAITNGSPNITGLSSFAGIFPNAPISGIGIPAGTVISSIDPIGPKVILSAPATATVAKAALTSPFAITLTTPTTQNFNATQSSITISGKATATGLNTLSVVLADDQDVVPGDPGSASISASGPSLIAGTAPPVYQGFFNTAGSVTTTTTSTPPGFAFTRSFQQILAVLYGYNPTSALFATQSYQGGFFPVGVGGTINSAI